MKERWVGEVEMAPLAAVLRLTPNMQLQLLVEDDNVVTEKFQTNKNLDMLLFSSSNLTCSLHQLNVHFVVGILVRIRFSQALHRNKKKGAVSL